MDQPTSCPENKAVKIAIVTPYIHHGGGVPAVVRYLYEVLSQEHDCHLISVSTSKSDTCSVRLLSPASWLKGLQIKSSTWEGKPVLDVGAWFTELEFQRYWPRSKLTELLDGFDAVQIVAGAPAWAYIARDVKKPVFLQVATLVKEERRQMISIASGWKKRYLQVTTAITGYIEALALRRVDIVFVENLWMHSRLTGEIGAAKVVLSPPGVDAHLFQPSKTQLTTSSSPEKYLLSVGRFNDRRKNAALMFEAYYRLRAINPNTPRLILAGLNGPDEQDWQLAKRLGIADHIEFRLGISQQELVVLLQGATIFVCSSDEEGLGIAMLEALACGTPVVTTRCGGPDIFMRDGVNGYLVERNDPEAMAARINQILADNGLRAQMAIAARQSIEQGFSEQATAKIFLQTYRQFSY